MKQQVKSVDTITLYVEHGNRTMFMQQYGIDFELQNPGVKITVLDTEYSGIRQPDLIFIGSFEKYKQLVDEGRLTPLDSYINQDRNKLIFYLESLMTIRGFEMFQSYTKDALYALPLALYSGALFYNKDLFDQYNIPYPSDYITWDEVIELAQRFPTHTNEGKPLYGLSSTAMSGPITYIVEVAYMQGLPFFDSATWTISMNNPEWRTLWEAFLPGMKAGHFQLNQPVTPTNLDDHPFFLGQAAMLRDTILLIHHLEKRSQTGDAINWDMVTIPIISRNYPKSPYYMISEAYGIASDSPNKEAAWELLSFIIHHNPSVTKVADRSLEPLYTLEFDYRPTQDIDILRLQHDLQLLASKQLIAVIQGEKTLDEALQQLELEGQNMLNEFRMKKDKSN